MKQLLIYVPGLGNSKTIDRQRLIIKRWDNEKTDSLFLDPKWQDKESIDEKMNRLIGKIKNNVDFTSYTKITIVGASAGGSLGLNLFNNFKEIKQLKFISVCGKLRNVTNVGRPYRRKNPAFIDSVLMSEKIQERLSKEDKKRILSVTPLFDELVNKECMVFEGIKTKRQYTIGHVISIGYAILFKVSLFRSF